MSELTVEPVESIETADPPAGVDAPEYVLYGGKGGVGKTTCAAATALASARGGTPTLVVSTDPAHSLSDTLETDIPAEPTRIREYSPLFAVEIDPESTAFEGPFAAGADDTVDTEFDGTGLGGLGELLGGETGHPLGGAMPGADEAAAMQLLIEYLDDPRFERVVVDTAPTGHTLRLLELPEVMDSMMGRLLAFKQRLSGMAGSLGGFFGDDDTVEDGTASLKELSAKIEKLRAALEDPSRTDFRVVTIPEAMSVTESERLIDRLEGFGIPVGTVVVNRVSEDLTAAAGLDEEWFVAPDTENCEFCRRRWEVQREALSRAQDLFRGREVKRIPLFAEAVRGEAMLGVVASCLD
ncbi:TRC40/GET3/ArsA family transport-energizing ATPase [Natronomonas sp. F2-12]|jgi:arsenite-transporting ATPase|uniref:TRC40/GET3/ArsA family transport-energizing ATPase n=1 Tax=Natronomonas aquatica TaxID=2841590 RepID=A0A9R1D580_9EURY|nr:TRC40/GET3/ArsA family transport-energizing ATPase [Natronomonas aquatica]MCQ4332083.1 TRC40/GET3/ArsA family transport-energizing ATPase [Natronomonas aquatica]